MAINFVQKTNGSAKVATVPSAVPPMDISALIAAAVADAMAKVMAPSHVAAPKAQAVDPAMVAEIARLKAENAKLAAAKPVAKVKRPLVFKVSEKRAMSIYNLGARFPVTLYKEQMLALLDAEKDIRAFLKDNDALLANKGDN
jgi:hypothetical protein